MGSGVTGASDMGQPDRGRLLRLLDLSAPAFLAVLLVGTGVAFPHLVSWPSAMAILSQSVPIFVIALAAGIVLISGSIDLSAGLIVSFVGVTFGYGITAGWPLPFTLCAGLAGALAVGAWNGLLAGGIGLPAFVVTLATSLALQGVNLFLSPGVIVVRDPILRAIGRGSLGGVPYMFILATVVALASHILLRRTAFGLRTYAIGSQRENARLAGLSVRVQQFAVFVIGAVFCFVCAFVLLVRTSTVTPTVGGMPLLLDGIAAAVIGGTSLFGGRGSVGGILCGTLIIGSVTHILRATGIDPSSLDLAKGLLIGAALLSDVGLRLAKSRRLKPLEGETAR